MKFYLSSYKFGNAINTLQEFLPPNSKVGHINNARDFTKADRSKSEKHQRDEVIELKNLGYIAESVDLKNYFQNELLLLKKIEQLDGIWVSGGNTFVLRQAMKLSGFDNAFSSLRQRENFTYAGYSAGVCVLCDSLKYIKHVDNPHDFPYEKCQETIWDGLNVFRYGILPHFMSAHAESTAISKEVERCIENKWLFKVLRDGEVLIFDDYTGQLLFAAGTTK